MSWCSGSQLTPEARPSRRPRSRRGSQAATAATIARGLWAAPAWEMRTARGTPVEPLVSCRKAVSSGRRGPRSKGAGSSAKTASGSTTAPAKAFRSCPRAWSAREGAAITRRPPRRSKTAASRRRTSSEEPIPPGGAAPTGRAPASTAPNHSSSQGKPVPRANISGSPGSTPRALRRPAAPSASRRKAAQVRRSPRRPRPSRSPGPASPACSQARRRRSGRVAGGLGSRRITGCAWTGRGDGIRTHDS